MAEKAINRAARSTWNKYLLAAVIEMPGSAFKSAVVPISIPTTPHDRAQPYRPVQPSPVCASTPPSPPLQEARQGRGAQGQYVADVAATEIELVHSLAPTRARSSRS